MVYYSAIKKNGILSFAAKWIELENIMLSTEKLYTWSLTKLRKVDMKVK